jgi:hypothetical protein
VGRFRKRVTGPRQRRIYRVPAEGDFISQTWCFWHVRREWLDQACPRPVRMTLPDGTRLFTPSGWLRRAQ